MIKKSKLWIVGRSFFSLWHFQSIPVHSHSSSPWHFCFTSLPWLRNFTDYVYPTMNFLLYKELRDEFGSSYTLWLQKSPCDSRITCIFNWKAKTRAWDTGVPLPIFYLWVNLLSRYFLGLKHCSYPERNMWFNIYSGKSPNCYRRYFSKDNPLTYIKVMKICRKFMFFVHCKEK